MRDATGRPGQHRRSGFARSADHHTPGELLLAPGTSPPVGMELSMPPRYQQPGRACQRLGLVGPLDAADEVTRRVGELDNHPPTPLIC